MSNKKTQGGLPKLGGNVMEIGEFIYRMIVILSDHLDPKDQEMVVYQYGSKEKAQTMKETILIEGISITQKDKGIEIDVYYPARQIRKIITRKEPKTIKGPVKVKGSGSKRSH